MRGKEREGERERERYARDKKGGVKYIIIVLICLKFELTNFMKLKQKA